MARPSKYTELIAGKILSRFANGETLSKICEGKNMPERNTVYRWRRSYPEFGEAYEIAIEEHTDALIDEAGQIVDTELNPQRAKVRADHRRWLASRLNRNKYGDKIDVNHNVSIDIAPLLLAANKRLAAIGVIDGLATPQNALIEGGNSDTDSM